VVGERGELVFASHFLDGVECGPDEVAGDPLGGDVGGEDFIHDLTSAVAVAGDHGGEETFE